jgi:hypothetical protein
MGYPGVVYFATADGKMLFEVRRKSNVFRRVLAASSSRRGGSAETADRRLSLFEGLRCVQRTD